MDLGQGRSIVSRKYRKRFRCHCAYLTAPLPRLEVCFRRSMHLAKSIRLFRATSLFRYALPLSPSISLSLFHFCLTLRGLLITSFISLSGFLWVAIWPRWCVHEGVPLCVIMHTRVCSRCARVFLSGCPS